MPPAAPSPAGHEADGGRAWLVAIAAAAANVVTFGTLFSFGVFLTPLADAFGTTTGGVSPLFSVAVALYYAAGAVAGRIGDRYGVRRVVVTGGVALPVGLFLAADATALWQVYLAYAPLVGLAVGCCYVPLIGSVGRWFERQRALAIAVVLVGVGGGTLVMPNVSEYLIDAYGWRRSFQILAVAGVIVIAAVALVLGDEPLRQPKPVERVERPRLLASVPYRYLFASVVLIGPGFYAPLAFYNDFAVARGISGEAAAALIGLVGGSSVIARLAFGSLTNRIGSMRQYRAGYALLTAALVTWLVSDGNYPLLVLSAILHGLGWAAWVAAAPLVLTDWFGVQDLGGTLGAFYTGLGVGGLFGPAIGGWIIDRWGYEQNVMVVIATNLGALVLAAVAARSARLHAMLGEQIEGA